MKKRTKKTAAKKTPKKKRVVKKTTRKKVVKKKTAIKKTTRRKNPCGTTRKNPKKSCLPSLLVDIADALSVDLEDGRVIKFKRSENFALCSNRKGNELWIVSRKGGKTVQGSDEPAERLYEAFTGFEHDNRAKLIDVRPKPITRIGRAMSIQYRSDKFARPGNSSDYIHTFNVYPVVSVDDDKHPSIVVLRGGRIKVKKEGITG